MANRRLQCELAVVGAGPAGLAAASVAAECGCQVVLLDDSPWLGGQIWRGQQAHPGLPEAQRWFRRFQECGATILDRTTVVAAPTPGALLAEREGEPVQLKYQRLVLATGGRELFLPFDGWTLPGVMGPGGLLNLAKQGWPVRGRRVVVAGSGPLLLAAAAGLRKLGAKIVLVAEQSATAKVTGFALALGATPGKLWQALRLKLELSGAPYRCGVWPVRAGADGQLREVTMTNGRRTWTEACDLLACGFGLVPNVELPLHLGCDLRNGFVAVNEWQATSVQNVYCAGEPTGLGGADCALVEGQIAGYAAGGQTASARALFPVRRRWHGFRKRLAHAFALRPELKSLASDETIFCRCEDVRFGRVKQFDGWREAKLLSRCGMGPCQGRVCGAAAKAIFGWTADSIRPPVLPVRVASLIAGAGSETPVRSETDNRVKAEPATATPETGAVYSG